MTTYSMVTISGNTRIRQDHNVYAAVLATVANANVTVFGDELWTAPANGSEVMAGDKWVKVSHNGVMGWMAYIHKGVPICKNFVTTETPPPAGNDPVFPLSFILTDPATGKSAMYEFVRIVE